MSFYSLATEINFDFRICSLKCRLQLLPGPTRNSTKIIFFLHLVLSRIRCLPPLVAWSGARMFHVSCFQGILWRLV